MPLTELAYHELCAYTLSLGDAEFIHQHVVDAYAAQTPDATSKPIRVAFALFGLYLHVERGYTGRQVQRVHMGLAKQKRVWPTFLPPTNPTAMTARDVIRAAEGPARDRAIHEWAAAVWRDWSASHAQVREYLRTEMGL